jgi:S-adenosylmethionine-diacylglycerol 3-amino-3-carboxypropyl transferase
VRQEATISDSADSGVHTAGTVESDIPVSGKGILRRLFAVWFDALIYNQIWEDPRVDVEALALDSSSRILTISSGGCNALNYLLENPQSVTAVDLNRHHIYLLRLKLAALKFLPAYEDFFAFFGAGRAVDADEKYRKYIAPNLDSDSRAFWEGGILGGRINFFKSGGLYNHSRNGYFLRFFHRFSRLVGCRPENILNAKSREEQEQLYQTFIAPFFDSFVIKTIGKLPVTMFGLGIPPQQYDELKKELGAGGSIIDVYRERVRRLACDHDITENYFAWQAFARKYDTENCRAIPDYLKRENYETLKHRAGKITASIESVTEKIRQSEPGAYNRFVFLDAQDWMDAGALCELWQAIADKAEPGSRIIFRTAGAASPVETNIPAALRQKFTYENALSRDLFPQDRASIYGGFHLYLRALD